MAGADPVLIGVTVNRTGQHRTAPGPYRARNHRLFRFDDELKGARCTNYPQLTKEINPSRRSWWVCDGRIQCFLDVTKHCTGSTVRTGSKYRSLVLVLETLVCFWCGAYYWFRLRKGTGYGFHAFLTCILILLLLIQCKISLYLGPVRTVQCFVTPMFPAYSVEAQAPGVLG